MKRYFNSCLVGLFILGMTYPGLGQGQATVVPPQWYSEGLGNDEAGNPVRTMTFYSEKPDACSGNGCNEDGDPTTVSTEGTGGGGGGGGGGDGPLENDAAGGGQIAGALLGPVVDLANQGLSNLFGGGGREQEMAAAAASQEAASDWVGGGGPARVAEQVDEAMTDHWSSGHFYSQTQYETEEAELAGIAQQIENGTFSDDSARSVVMHGPASDADVRDAVSTMLKPAIDNFKYVAGRCGGNAFCEYNFDFSEGAYVTRYSEMAKSLELPKFEGYVSMVEQGVDRAAAALENYLETGINQPDAPLMESPKGGLLKALSDLGKQLSASQPDSEIGTTAKGIGLEAVRHGQASTNRGDYSSAESAREVALAMLDIALGLTPGVGFGKDVYEAISGESIVTGEPLSDDARLLAAIGAMSLGIADEGVKLGKVIDELATDARVLNKELQSVQSLGSDGVNTMLKDRYGLQNAPYRSGSRVYRYKAGEESNLSRVYTEGTTSAEGPWVLDDRQIAGLTPQEIAEKFSLPNVPTHASKVEVPPGTLIERGPVNKAVFDGNEEVAYQYRLIDYTVVKFLPGSPLP